MSAQKKPKKKAGNDKPPDGTSFLNNLGADDEVARRRRAAVIRMLADAYSERDIADALLKVHMSGDTRHFTFVGADRKPIDEKKIPFAELRERAFTTIRKDVLKHREEHAPDPKDPHVVAAFRHVLLEGLRQDMRELTDRMRGNPEKNIAPERDNARFNQMMKTKLEYRMAMGRLQGIETEKPAEIRVPEKIIVWIDDGGIIHKRKEPWDGTVPMLTN